MKKLLVLLCAMLFVFGIVMTANAVPVQWSIADGGNGNWYDAISYSSNWENAKIDAQSRGGYLATLTSANENAFVWNNLPYNLYFLGGYQINRDSEPSGNWAWVTGEPWNYTNWHPNEPNDGVGYPTPHEEYLEFKGITTIGEWNDIYDVTRDGYIIEYKSNPMSVPDASVMLLLGTSLIGLLGFGRRSKRS